MNYLRQLRSYYDWINQNQCSSMAQLLYHTLLLVNNMVGWVEWFSRTNPSLAGLMGVSENTLKKARNELSQLGLIEFKSGSKKNSVTKYRIVKLYQENNTARTADNSVLTLLSNTDTQADTQNNMVSNFDTQADTNTDTQADTQNDTQADDLYKHKLKHKHKQKEIKNIYASHVQMTEAQYEKLVTEHGQELTNKIIETLNNYKAANGKNYKSDYHAILNWVVDKCKANKATGGISKIDKKLSVLE